MPAHMTSILALDTSTDACSVALYDDGELSQQLKQQPRQHNRILFPMLEELLPAGKRASLDALAYTSGPGSFTGLRVGCSAAQGLAFTLGLPCVPITTLACLAQGAVREGLAANNDLVLSLLDARVGELYFALYRINDGLPEAVTPAAVARPESFPTELPGQRLIAVGDGLALAEHLPGPVLERFDRTAPDLSPQARDLFPLALAALERGEVVAAAEVLPVYVRDEISWKKLPEQGRRE